MRDLLKYIYWIISHPSPHVGSGQVTIEAISLEPIPNKLKYPTNQMAT